MLSDGQVCDPLQLSLSVVGALECVVRRCVGPSGGSVIFTKDTGQTLITKHGHSVLTALQLEHPVARTVLECLRSHDHVAADGSKSFVLLLSALLRGIRDSMHDSSCAHRRHASWKLANQLHAFYWGELDNVIAHTVVPYASSLFGPGGCEPEGGVLAALVGGYLSGRVSPGKAELLMPLLCEFCMRVGRGHVDAASIAFIHSNFSELHSAMSGLHSAQSRVVEGLLLDCDWSVWAETDGPVTALVVLERLDARPDGTDESVSVQFEENWMVRTDGVLQQRLAAFRRLQVNVVMSAVKQPGGVLEWAGLNAVSVLDCCDPVQLELLCELNKAHTMTAQPLMRVGTLTHCRRYQLGGRRYAHVGLAHTSLHTHTLVLCAPAEGALQQSVSASRGVFTMLQHLSQSHRHNNISPCSHPPSLTSHSTCPNLLHCMLHSGDVIPVGGAFEFVLHHSLLNSNDGDPESRRLLADAVLSVPRTLHAHRPGDFLQRLVSFRKELLQHRPIKEQGSGSEFTWGLGADGGGRGVCVESVCSKHQLVSSVLQCVSRLLRVETVMHTVRSLAPAASPESDPEEEEEEEEDEDGT